jgi:hypothetical protein
MAKKIGEHGEKSNRKSGTPVAPTGMCLPLPLISAALPQGKRNKYPQMIPMYVRAI